MKNILDQIKFKFKYGNIVIKLIIVNLFVFLAINLLQVVLFLFTGSNSDIIIEEILNWLSIPSSFQIFMHKPWTIVTYMFVHKGFFHFLFNMIWLYWFGKIFLMYLDEKKLLGLYFGGGLAGALTYMLVYNLSPAFSHMVPYSIMMGASAAIMAIVFAISFYVPNYTINLMFIGQIKLKHIAIFSIALDVLMMSSNNAGGHISHLGGALFGYLFIMQYKKQKDITKWIWQFFYTKPKQKTKRKRRNPNMHVSYKKPKTDMQFNKQKADVQKEMDRILDKISQKGYSSLSAKEKEFLFKYSKKH